MRNLLETSRVHFDLAIVLGISTENFHVLASTWDAASDDIFCTYSRHDDGVSLELSRIKVAEHHTLF